MKKFKLQAALHDLRPNVLEECATAVDLLHSAGFGRLGLALIPDWEGSTPAQRESFETWALGHSEEFWLLHGYRHRAHPDLPRSWLGRQLQKLCHSQAEFAGLNRQTSEVLVEQALSSLSSQMPMVKGFVAPTWHAPYFLPQICASMGLEFYESRLWMGTLKRKNYSFPLSFPSLAGDELWLKALDMAVKLAPLPIPLRLVLHPEDVQTPLRRERVGYLLKKLAKYREFEDYGSGY